VGLDPGSAAARIQRVAYERIGLAIARGHAQQLLVRLGCVDVCRAYRILKLPAGIRRCRPRLAALCASGIDPSPTGDTPAQGIQL
jgi:hypothetical protein